MIKRRKYIKRSPSKDAHKLYVICEGEITEPSYFHFFDGLSSRLNVIIIPQEEGSDPLKLIKLVEKLFINSSTRKYNLEYKNGDTVWFVVDTDSWEEERKLNKLREFCHNRNKKIGRGKSTYDMWNIAQSNPSFEIWMYYHIYEEKPDEQAVENGASLKEFVNKQISGGFDFEKDPCRLERAIKNTDANSSFDKEGRPGIFSSGMFRLGKEILSIVKPELDKLCNKF